MASFHAKVRAAHVQVSPVVEKLRGVFDGMDDDELLEKLTGRVHRGCQGYPVFALWRSYLAAYVLNLPSVAQLVRALQDNPAVARACSLDPGAIPSEATYSRFAAKLTAHRHLVEETFKRCVSVLYGRLPDFGNVVAIDSTDVAAYSQSRRPSDMDARWSKKKDKHGRDKWWFGYKVHMAADATHELPIRLEVTPANVGDTLRFIPLALSLPEKPQVLTADAGYDAAENYALTFKVLGAAPIIKLNPRGRKSDDRPPHRSAKVREALRLRDRAGLDRDSAEWQSLYNMRVSIERLFGRMKEFRRLTQLRHRGLPKVTLHAQLSALATVAGAVSAAHRSENVRKVA